MRSTRAEEAPRVTVLMSVYNGERYLRKAIESILGQTFTDFEFLIVNDGSTDSSRNIVLSYSDVRIRLFDNEENIGLTKSLNRGLALARGEYIARMDSDDISYPDRLYRQLLFMQNNPEIAVLGTQVNYIDCQGRPLKVFAYGHPISPLAAKYNLMFGSPVAHPTAFFRKKIIWDKFGGYDPTYVVGQDTELWCRVGIEHLIQNLPDILVAFRLTPLSVSSDMEHPRRATHVNLWKRRRPDVMKDILGENTISSEWAECWELIHSSHPFIGKNATMRMVRGLDMIQELFFRKFPASKDSLDILMLTADAKAKLALYLLGYARIASLPIFCQVLKMNRQIGFLYAPKYFSMLIFGHSAKKLYRIVRRCLLKK